MECVLATLAFIVFVVVSAVSEHRRREREINRTLGVYNQPVPQARIRKGIGPERFQVLRSSFQRFADRVGGQLVTGKFTGSPRVIFHHHGARAMLSLHDTELADANLQAEPARFSTRLTFKVPRSWPLRLEIFPQDGTVDARFLKIYDLVIGEPEFDARFVIKANDGELAKEFLDGATRETVNALYGLPPFLSIVLSLNRERLIVSKPSLIHDVSVLADFAAAASRLYERIEFFVDRLSGVEVMVSAPKPGDEAPVCTVCGSDVGAQGRVFCRRCATPLHKDCWSYNGKCPVFGCGEERFRT